MKYHRQYLGFEQGPIRPPSEAGSLLIRVTRNCSWNQCTFCPIYKGSQFSTRPIEHVLNDIDSIYKFITKIQEQIPVFGGLNQDLVNNLYQNITEENQQAFQASLAWYQGGMKSIFLQDANSPVLKAHKLVQVLQRIQERFPQVERVTTYARSQSINRYQLEELLELKAAGLNRIHIGMESGSDEVLKRVKKGTTKKEQIQAGQKVKKAGIELSEYVMPGLGGKELSRVHALETADALNQIQPDFIRLRTLAVPESTELFTEQQAGNFIKNTERETVQEIFTFIDHLTCSGAELKSDHILNLLETLEGKLPDDKEKLLNTLNFVLELEPESWVLFQIGRRFSGFKDAQFLAVPEQRQEAERIRDRLGITPENADHFIDEQMKRFI